MVTIELVVLVMTLLVIFGHALWVRWDITRQGPILTRARAILAQVLNPVAPDQGDEIELTWADLEAVRALPDRVQAQVFVELARNLSGRQKEGVTHIAGQVGFIAGTELSLQSRLWWRRLRATRLLTLLGAGKGSMPRLLRDPHPRVRAQAADWAATYPSPEIIAALLNMLEDPAKLCRFTAQNSLLRIGAAVGPLLADYVTHHAGPRLVAALEVAVGLAQPGFLAPALKLCRDGSPSVRTLAATLLGQIGGMEAASMLQELLRDPEGSVRAEAARGLGKLGEWPAAPALAGTLRDPSWDVRREAGLALRAMGSPGILLLRRSLSDRDAFAADMARQVLDIPPSALARPVL